MRSKLFLALALAGSAMVYGGAIQSSCTPIVATVTPTVFFANCSVHEGDPAIPLPTFGPVLSLSVNDQSTLGAANSSSNFYVVMLESPGTTAPNTARSNWSDVAVFNFCTGDDCGGGTVGSAAGDDGGGDDTGSSVNTVQLCSDVDTGCGFPTADKMNADNTIFILETTGARTPTGDDNIDYTTWTCGGITLSSADDNGCSNANLKGINFKFFSGVGNEDGGGGEQSVPEPLSLGLVGAGLVSLYLLRRRR
jgi:hypothetical protein